MIAERIERNVQQIEAEMADACHRAGRKLDDVRLIAVTKYAEWEWIEALRMLCRSGRVPVISGFGENRPQQLVERQQQMPDMSWHLIGQLQRNKVRPILSHAAVIHSIDSVRLLERVVSIGKELNSLDFLPRVLLQVNLSREEAKSGFDCETIRASWNEIVGLSDSVRIEGLMTMAAESDNSEDARPVFRELRALRDELVERPESAAAGLTLKQLSMGMSSDFVPAIEEGATMIRVGSRVFEGLPG